MVGLWFSWKMALVATAPAVVIVLFQLALTAYLKRRTHDDNEAALEAAKVSRMRARPQAAAAKPARVRASDCSRVSNEIFVPSDRESAVFRLPLRRFKT